MAIYLINNTIVDENTPFFTPKSRGYRYGDGFFESCKLANGRILQLPLHGDRIRKSALLLKLHLPTWWDEISWETSVLKACKDAKMDAARIRLTIFRDAEGLYTPTNSNVCMVTEINAETGIGPYQWKEEGLHIGTYKELVKNSNYTSTLKTCSALIYTLAGIYAKEHGLDDVVIFNEFGRPCESVSSNIFVVKGEFLLTPPISEYCIDGVMRKVIMQLADAYGYSLQERPISEIDLSASEEIFTTSATRGISWVADYQGKKLKNTVSRVLFEQLVKSI
jgi:branched-chain amino acid aminotransferase